MRTSIILAGILMGSAWALPSQDAQTQLDEKVEDIDSRRGLTMTGDIRSIFLRSVFESDQDKDAYNRSPDTEREGFSQLDLNFNFRPQQTTRANLVLRLSSAYQNFFNAGAKLVSIPWMNIEGQYSDKLYWVVGDFRQEYGKLSLSSPDVEILYEPEIFRRNRFMARDQVFLEGTKRNLQGANVQFRYDMGGILGEVRTEAMLSRLRRTEVLDFSGAMGNILPNDSVPGASQASGMDKILYGANVEWLPISKNAVIGVTPLFVKDLETSNTTVYRQMTDPATFQQYWEQQSVNPGVLGPENSSVITVRAGADGAAIMGNESIIIDLLAEYAMSTDDGYSYTLDGNGLPVIEKETYKGTALLADLNAGYQQKGSFMVNLQVNYLMNDTNWYNTLAQSPSFFARRIMNSDKDPNTLKYGTLSPLYSTFDALYHFDPKYAPPAPSMMPDPLVSDQTGSYNIAPFNKNSWNTGVYTRDELALINGLNDFNVVSALPNGVATANRVGPKLNLTAGIGKDNALEVQAIFTALEEASKTAEDKAKFSEMGGGARIDASAFLGFALPLEFSGSYRAAEMKQGDVTRSSSFINTGFYGKFHKRMGVSLGLQMIQSKLESELLKTFALPLTKSDQMQWMAGVDYNLGKNAWLAFNVGAITVDNTYETSAAITTPDVATGTEVASGITEYLPDYIVADINRNPAKYQGKNEIKHSFSQTLTEATINVSF